MKSKLLDKIAIISALCCALHCTLLSVLLTITALSSLQFLKNPLVEWIFICVGTLLAYTSLRRSISRHNNYTPLKLAFLGIILLVTSRFGISGVFEILITCLGSIFIIIAHSRNIILLNVKSKGFKSF